MSTLTPGVATSELHEPFLMGVATTQTDEILEVTSESIVRVSTSSSAKEVNLVFAPVSIEEAKQTRGLNAAVRLGYLPPPSSTR